MPAPLLLTSGLAKCEAVVAKSEAVLHRCMTSPVCLFYTIAIVFQLYQSIDMLYQMRRKNPKPILLPTKGIFNLPYLTDIL